MMRNMNVGNINGGNNQFNQNNNNHHYNIKNSGGGSGNKGGDPAGDGMAILIGIFGVAVVTAFVYLRYYDSIFFWLKIGVVIACVLHMMTFVAQLRDPMYTYPDSFSNTFGMCLVLCQGWLILTIMEAMPPAVFDIVNQPIAAKGWLAQAMAVWGRFNHRAHNIIMENMTATLCLAPAIALNILYGAQHLFATLTRSEQSRFCEIIADLLEHFKIWAAALSALLTLAAYAIITGLLTANAA